MPMLPLNNPILLRGIGLPRCKASLSTSYIFKVKDIVKEVEESLGKTYSTVGKDISLYEERIVVVLRRVRVGYPARFKNNFKGNNSKVVVNNVTTCGSGNSIGNTHILTSDEYQKLMSLVKSFGSGTTCDIGNVTEFVDKSASTEGSTNNNAKPDSSLAVASDSAHHTTVQTSEKPDISYVVHKLSQAMHRPLKSDLKLTFRVLRYLKGAPGMGVIYKASDGFELTAFVDSDWAKFNVTRKSVTGYTVFLGSCLVSWKTKKQSILVKSSAEAEYRAMPNIVCEII
ncbi:hypothetical protein Tco_0373365 [Tanacetum coccineum]